MPDYEICYLTADDRVSLFYRTCQLHDRDAVSIATRPIRLRYKSFEIWRGDECVRRGINPEIPN